MSLLGKDYATFLNFLSRKTRTCIHSPGYSRMVPSDLSHSKLVSALEGARIVYFDGRLHETALVVAQEVITLSFHFHLD